ncbi:hypothetical protein [Phenylobacterium sp.]|uniref:hypothetical protein n=1 Tax=Phenylobacterium sp. TaxID=1871053 RepID=UPI00121A8905|nr:hypothetical protein [Phenylobacterium sp.]THD62253.1 MAG: hypothetical protein E8A49_08275 [Phenylobacterium sp.]
MPLDYGQRRKLRAPRGLAWAAGLAALGLAAGLTWNWRAHRAMERDQGWISAAPPCPGLTAQAYRGRYAAHERVTDYAGATLARQFGHVMCKDVDTAGGFGFVTHPVCQFTSPTALRVHGPSGEAFFEPGPGHLATVSVERRRTLCALGGKFTLFEDPTQ